MKAWWKFAVLLVVAATTISAGRATAVERVWEITPFGGYVFYGKAFEDAPYGGARLRWNWNPILGIQGRPPLEHRPSRHSWAIALVQRPDP